MDGRSLVWTAIVTLALLLASTIGAYATTGTQGAQETTPQYGPTNGPAPQGGGQDPGGQGGGPSGSGQGGPPPHANASQTARERTNQSAAQAGGEPHTAWNRGMDQARGAPGLQAREEALQAVAEHERGNMGLFSPDGQDFTGRFVSFTPAEDWIAIEDVTVGGVLVFHAITMPPDENMTVLHAGNAIHIRGDGWRFTIVDAPPAPITMRTSGDAFLAVLPDDVLWQPTGFGGVLEYPAGDGAGVQARLVGPDPRDGEVPGLLEVSQSLNFHLSADRAVLSHVANKEREAIDEALTRRAVGAEVTLLGDPRERRNLVSDVVVYEDMDVTVTPGRGFSDVPANATAHTITVTAEGIPGKTVVVNLDQGLVDPRALHLRYYTQVSEGVVEEVGIRVADSLAHVLAPDTAGLVPKYWVVEDIDGVQLLVAIPHFSTHHIELLSFHPQIVTISLVAGVVGAVVLVVAATAGLFRRPQDAL